MDFEMEGTGTAFLFLLFASALHALHCTACRGKEAEPLFS